MARVSISIAAGLLIVGVLGGCGGHGRSSSSGACAAPMTTAQPVEVSAGMTLTVSADHMFDDCADQGVPVTVHPLRGQEVIWSQAGSTLKLAVVDADVRGLARVTVTVPATARPGSAKIALGIADPVTVTVSADH